MAWWDQNKKSSPSTTTTAAKQSSPGLNNRAQKWYDKGSDMLENQRLSEMNRLIGRFQDYGTAENIGKQSNFADKIRGLGSTFTGEGAFDIDALLNSLYAKPGGEGYYDPSQYAWAPQVTEPQGTDAAIDVDMTSSLDDLANVPGANEVSTALPAWLQLDDPGKMDVAQADLRAQWVQDQRRQAGQDRAANVAAQQLEDVQGLADTDVISDEDIARMMGGYAGSLAGTEQRTMGAIRDNMGARGMAPGSGIGAGMAGQASLQRQMGLAQAGNQLGTQQMMANRQGLERALGLQSNAASNLENVLTGFGTTQWNLPSQDYANALRNPNAMADEDDTPMWMRVLGL